MSITLELSKQRLNAWSQGHAERLRLATEATHARGHYAPFVESPSRKFHPEGAHANGKAAFEAHLGTPFGLKGPAGTLECGSEVSPYTGAPLNISYNHATVEALVAAAEASKSSLAALSPAERVALSLEILHRWEVVAFENAYATMHTAGQPFLLAFAGSGASSLERGLEAVVHAAEAMARIPANTVVTRGSGAHEVVLEKRFALKGRGVGAVIACGSYPAWNAYPAILANLTTGNPTIVKPSPRAILPLAIAVREAQAVLQEAGVDPHALLLAVDSVNAPITKALVEDPRVRLVDFTGGQTFGAWLERTLPGTGTQVFTETSGTNVVLMESVRDLDATLDTLAHGFSFFSGQMCTAPQNLVLPPRVDDASTGEAVDAHDVVRRLADKIESIATDPARAAAILGAVQNGATVENLRALTRSLADHGAEVVREPSPYVHPEFPNAQTLSPGVFVVDATSDALSAEHFGPVVLATIVESRSEALMVSTSMVQRNGSIANYAYTTDPAFAEAIEEAFFDAGSSISLNLVRQIPIHLAAAFSDFHVTGLNPAGNACLTDLSFVASRFRIVQRKTERPTSSES